MKRKEWGGAASLTSPHGPGAAHAGEPDGAVLKELVLSLLSPSVQPNLAAAGFAQLPAAQLQSERNEVAAINPYVAASGPASAPAGATQAAAAASAGGGLPWWAVLVIVLGALALLAALGGAAFVLRHRRRRRRSLPLSVRCAAQLCCRRAQGSQSGVPGGLWECLEGCWSQPMLVRCASLLRPGSLAPLAARLCK